MLVVKSVLLMLISTSRILIPGIVSTTAPPYNPDLDARAPAYRNVSFLLASTNPAGRTGKSVLYLPPGLNAGNSVTMALEKLPATEANALESMHPGYDVVFKSYYGSGESVPEGQPKLEVGEGVASSLAVLPDKTRATWPPVNADGPEPASCLGAYALTSQFAGSLSFSLTSSDGFLPPVELTGIPKVYDLSKPVTIEWKAVKGAQAYLLTALGGNAQQSIMWTSSTLPAYPRELESTPLTPQELKTFVDSGALLPASSAKAVIPAGVFAGSDSVVLLMTAVGKDKVVTDSGVELRVVRRSTLSVPMFSKSE